MSKWIWILLLFLLVSEAHSLRINKPPRLSNPPTEEEIIVLNKFLEDMWNITNGRYQLDVVTTPKTDAESGEFWIIQTGTIGRLQWKTGNLIFTSP